MTEQNPNPIVVAVPEGPIESALGYAAAEAARVGCGLHLVHVVHVHPQAPELVLVDVTDVERLGEQALNRAREKARELVGEGVPVTGELAMGGIAPAIVQVAETDARMVVLQHRELSRARRVLTGSITSGVAAHTRVPVVSVPSDWQPTRKPEEVPTVTVGVDVPDRSEQVLRLALAAARSRGAALNVLHTWSLPVAYYDVAMTRTEDEAWSARASAEIRDALAELGDEVEGVPVHVEARHAYAADALIAASRTSELLVIGRHDPLVPIGSHLGPVARAVLREARCPVLLADPRHRPGPRARTGRFGGWHVPTRTSG